MPFGLCNALATFQRLKNAVLGDLVPSTCLVYLDDIIVFSRMFKEYVQRLRSVLDRLRDAHLKVKPSKGSLVKSSVGYLGLMCSLLMVFDLISPKSMLFPPGSNLRPSPVCTSSSALHSTTSNSSKTSLRLRRLCMR